MANEYYNKVNVLNLPRVSVINDNDYLIVQNDNNETQTSLIQFKNFVIDLKNTTFATTVEDLENNMYLVINRINYIADQYNKAINVLRQDTSLIDNTKRNLEECTIDLNSIA